MRSALLKLFLIAGCFMPMSAYGGPYRATPAMHPPGPAEPEGCYWFEGKHYCARYCYWEVDGRRFCREEKELAVPQGPMPEVVAIPESPKQLYRPYK